MLVSSNIPVPYWEKTYAFSADVLNEADEKQLAFYHHFKEQLLGGTVLDVDGNENYVFALMFDLIRDFRSHRDQELVTRQLTTLETEYPVIRRYVAKNLADAMEGKPEKSLGMSISVDLSETFDDLMQEYPELFADDDGDDSYPEDEEFEIDIDDTDEHGNVERFDFPPTDTRHTLALSETLNDDYECLGTTVDLNGQRIADLKARLMSVRADLDADRLFLQTLHANSSDSFSIFSFQLSTGSQLWQVEDVPPGGTLYLDKASRRIEAGLTYGTTDNYLVLLDYDGNILSRNFRSGYDMVERAEELFKEENFAEAKELLIQGLGTSISISTKIKAAKKLLRIAKLTDDQSGQGEYAQLVERYETEKAAEKAQRAESTRIETLSLSERLAAERAQGNDAGDAFEDPGEESEFWTKRWAQIDEDGGK